MSRTSPPRPHRRDGRGGVQSRRQDSGHREQMPPTAGCGSWPPGARSVHGCPPGTGRKEEILGLPSPAAGRGGPGPGPTPAGWTLTWQGLSRRWARRSRSSSLATRCSAALTSVGSRRVHQHPRRRSGAQQASQPDVRAGSVRTCGGSHRRAGAARQETDPTPAQGAGQRRVRGGWGRSRCRSPRLSAPR
jgi:hypothetical protein